MRRSRVALVHGARLGEGAGKYTRALTRLHRQILLRAVLSRSAMDGHERIERMGKRGEDA